MHRKRAVRCLGPARTQRGCEGHEEEALQRNITIARRSRLTAHVTMS